MIAKVLMRDEDGRPIAVACKTCGRLALNVETCLCCRCGLHKISDLLTQRKDGPAENVQ